MKPDKRITEACATVDGAASLPEPQGKRRALVADDNDSAREVLRKLLLAEGFECDVVRSGDEALARVAGPDAGYDIIFVDIIMPGMDGLELVREIRTRYTLPAIVMVTGVDEASRAREALRLGADEYVVKPYSISQLRLAWGQAFERRRQFGEQKRAERTRDEITELVFHDLKNPLTAARGYLSLMQACPDGVGPRDIAAAVQGCDLAVDIIEQGEELARIERSEIEVRRENLRLDELVRATVEGMGPMAEGAGTRIRVASTDDLPAVVADASLVKRVASALVAGAIKYASGEADILVDLSVSRDRSQVLLSITDDGLPVPPEFREAIFDRHSQGELKRAGSRRGRGLALPFAREACRHMGARIWVEDAEAPVRPCPLTDRQVADRGVGCRFVVAFRAASTTGAKPARAAAPASPSPSRPVVDRTTGVVDPTGKGGLQHE